MPLDIPSEMNDKESFMTTVRLATTAIAAMGPKSTSLSLLIRTSRPTWPCQGQGTWLKVCWCMAAFMAISSSLVKNSPFSLRTVEPMSVSLKKRSKMPQRGITNNFARQSHSYKLMFTNLFKTNSLSHCVIMPTQKKAKKGFAFSTKRGQKKPKAKRQFVYPGTEKHSIVIRQCHGPKFGDTTPKASCSCIVIGHHLTM